MGIVWELDKNKRILMGTFWELDGKSSPPPPFQKDKKHPLGACLHHPIGSPLTKIRNIPVDMLVLFTCFILMCFL
jgi:hypothetical protein